MNLARKLRKLVDPDIIASTREHLHRARHPVDGRRILAELEQDPGWEELRAKYPRRVAEVHRFGDTRFWIERNVERAQDLSLPRLSPRHILDLGCGAGFFLYVARQLGHSGIGLDIDEQPIFRDALKLTKVSRIVHRIEPFRRLPAPKRKFDLITSYLTCFHRLQRKDNGDWKTWSPEQWQFFLDDLRAHQLASGGTILLEFHPQRNGELYPAKVREFFRRNGGRLFRSKVFLH